MKIRKLTVAFTVSLMFLLTVNSYGVPVYKNIGNCCSIMHNSRDIILCCRRPGGQCKSNIIIYNEIKTPLILFNYFADYKYQYIFFIDKRKLIDNNYSDEITTAGFDDLLKDKLSYQKRPSARIYNKLILDASTVLLI